MDWEICGALAFGLVLGWNVYFVNRYRTGEVSFNDLTSLVSVVGGAAVLSLFEKGTELFGAYGVGLGLGFFSYFVVLAAMVSKSPNFDGDWFLDGRRVDPAAGVGYGTAVRQTVTPMAFDPARLAQAAGPAPVTVNFHGVHPADAPMVRSTGQLEVLAVPHPDAMRIQRACERTWSQSGPEGPFREASARYVVEVAQRLGIDLAGSLDEIRDRLLRNSVWSVLPDARAAREAALQGRFVVAFSRPDADGRSQKESALAVVVGGAMNSDPWTPSGYWGSADPSIAALGGGGTPISDCFGAKAQVVYYCREI